MTDTGCVQELRLPGMDRDRSLIQLSWLPHSLVALTRSHPTRHPQVHRHSFMPAEALNPANSLGAEAMMTLPCYESSMEHRMSRECGAVIADGDLLASFEGHKPPHVLHVHDLRRNSVIYEAAVPWEVMAQGLPMHSHMLSLSWAQGCGRLLISLRITRGEENWVHTRDLVDRVGPACTPQLETEMLWSLEWWN